MDAHIYNAHIKTNIALSNGQEECLQKYASVLREYIDMIKEKTAHSVGAGNKGRKSLKQKRSEAREGDGGYSSTCWAWETL